MKVHITLANINKIIFNSDIKFLNLSGEIYKIPIYYYSKFEKNALLAIQELLKDPENYFKTIYKPYITIDSYTLVYEEQKPAYHKHSICTKLNADYHNYTIPLEIKEKGPEAVIEFRNWFKTVAHLLLKPDVFAERLRLKYGIITNPENIMIKNSGITEIENYNIEELEERIEELIRLSKNFFDASKKNKEILSKFSKYTFLAYKDNRIKNNNTGYNDEEVKEILMEFDEKFKRPTKKLLIEYYRLKLNPKITMNDFLLKRLGFKECNYCNKNDYEIEENFKISWNFIIENSSFFLELFSTHYPFSEEQLLNFKDLLIFGEEKYIYSHYDKFVTTGLRFNKNIIWTEKLKDCYEIYGYLKKTYNEKKLKLEYKVIYSDRYPVVLDNLIDLYQRNNDSRYFVLGTIFEEPESKICHLDKPYEEYELLNTFSNSNYKFSKKEIFDLIKQNSLIIAYFEHFYKQIFEAIQKAEQPFSIDKFLDYFARNSNTI